MENRLKLDINFETTNLLQKANLNENLLEKKLI